MFSTIYFRAFIGTLCTLFFAVSIAQAQATAFTYQGQLSDGAAAASGTYQMQFSLFDAATAGTQIGSTITNTNVSVSNGVFTVQLDFSAVAPFATGANRFLQIAVKKAAETSYTTLTPRQPLTGTPYGPSLQLSATNTAAQSVPGGAPGPLTNISFNNIITAPTAGTFDGTTFTANAAGTYSITASITSEGTSNVGVFPELAGNSATVTYGYFIFYSNATSVNNRGRSQISIILTLNAGDTVLIRALGASTSAASPISTNGTTRLTIAKLN